MKKTKIMIKVDQIQQKVKVVKVLKVQRKKKKKRRRKEIRSKRPEEKKPNIATINKNNSKPEAKPIMSLASQSQAVNLKKVKPKKSAYANNVPEQKIKKILVNNRKNKMKYLP